MGLGETLRKAMDKIQGAGIVDKETVKEAIKEIQRALISANVDTTTVFTISKKIEENAFGEIKGTLSRREHITKVTYDALVEMLGGQKTPENPKRILLCGLFGAGKCVHPETIVPTPSGEIQTIKELYDKNQETELSLEDGFANELSKPVDVFSWDPISMKIIKSKATHLWKLKKDQPLYKITLDNGNNHHITTTPEHPFFVLENSEVKKIKAEAIKLGQFIATPRKITIESSEENSPRLGYIISEDLQINDLKICKEITNYLKTNYITLHNAFTILNENYSYITFTSNLKSGIIRQTTLKKIISLGYTYNPEEKIVAGKANSGARKITLPLCMTPELAEFLGYFYADGHLTKKYLEIVNEEDALIERITILGENLFNLKPSVKKDIRTKNLKKVIFGSIILTQFINSAFGAPFNKKSDKIRIPKQILQANKETKITFLQAYFDCDGYIAKGKRSIEFCTASKMMAEDLRVLLSSFDLVPSFSKRKIKEKDYFRVFLKAKDVELFAKEIGSKTEFKQQRLTQMASVGEGQTYGKQEMLHVGPRLKEVREYYGTTIGEIQKYVSSYGTYENEGLISRNALQNFLIALTKTKNKNEELLRATFEETSSKQLAEKLNEPLGWVTANICRLEELNLIKQNNGLAQITTNGMQLIKTVQSFDQTKLTQLEKLATAEIAWIKIKKIEIVDNTEYVYDLTVEDYHNFVANHIIVHNTTAAGKLAHYYTKREKKVGVICADTFRPAAFEQLQTNAKLAGADFFGIKGETKPEKIIKAGIKELTGKGCDLIICDSAGRSGLDSDLVSEIQEIDKAFASEEKWLVIGADMGNLAKKQAQAFHNAVGINGVIITRMDGSSKGGGALVACNETGASVYFISVGEKLNEFESFDANRYLSRIMGYGDLQGLLEKAKEAEMENLDPEELMKGNFNLRMFYEQLKATKKMGPLNKVAEMLGLSVKLPKEMLEAGQDKMDSFKVIIDSMTEQERIDPEVLNRNRLERIAKGAGAKIEDVRELIKQYKQMKKMFKKFKNIQSEKAMKNFGEKGIGDMLRQMQGKKGQKKFRLR
ncbi:MAG: LAGLIDADG family homing endonuclease [archaeon]